jgi:predicted O-methyltransferase YrrM
VSIVDTEVDEIKKLKGNIQNWLLKRLLKRLLQKDNIEGWLLNSEAKLLYNLAKNCSGAGVIVEIGSYKGKSTIYLGTGSKEGNNVKVYAIDPFFAGSQGAFKDNIKHFSVDDIVIPVTKTSEAAAESFRAPVELIFIDGDHRYAFVKRDLELWFPKVIEGGIMAFHDTVGWPGPKKVVNESVYKSYNFRNVRLVGITVVAEKVRLNSMKDRLKNKFKLQYKHLFDLLAGLAFRFYCPQLGKE